MNIQCPYVISRAVVSNKDGGKRRIVVNMTPVQNHTAQLQFFDNPLGNRPAPGETFHRPVSPAGTHEECKCFKVFEPGEHLNPFKDFHLVLYYPTKWEEHPNVEIS